LARVGGIFDLQHQLRDVVISARREGSAMLVELMLGQAMWVGLIGVGRPYRPYSEGLPLSAAILLIVGLGVLLLLLRLFRGPREPRGVRGWLDTRSARTIILGASVLVVAAMKLPIVAGVVAIIVIQAGLIWYALSVRHRRDQAQHPRSDRG
jgi:hypothetical protein